MTNHGEPLIDPQAIEIEERLKAAIEYGQANNLTLDIDRVRESLVKHFKSGERGRFVWIQQPDGKWNCHWVLPS